MTISVHPLAVARFLALSNLVAQVNQAVRDSKDPQGLLLLHKTLCGLQEGFYQDLGKYVDQCEKEQAHDPYVATIIQSIQQEINSIGDAIEIKAMDMLTAEMAARVEATAKEPREWN